MQSRSKNMLHKSIAAVLSAIEIYNKPDFKYRSETFAILCINSWELLLKARILQLNKNRVSSILQFEKRKRSDGTLSTKLYRVQNRSGNYNTVGLFKALDLLISEYGDTIPAVVRHNLEALVEIRDNSIHFLNESVILEKKVLELGTAAIKNYVRLAEKWLGADFSNFNLYLLPISFVNTKGQSDTIVLNSEENRLFKFLLANEKIFNNSDSDDFNYTLAIKVKFEKGKSPDNAIVVTNSKEDTAIKIELSEEDIREQYPWDYKILTTRLEKRYSDFKSNDKYHKIRIELAKNEKYCRVRFLDPGNPRSATKQFYNSNILKEFDAHYTMKKEDLTSN
ncbi:MAG: hypothetical protein A2Y07_09685 [Planctomycetes bacterium GWF2_50_10]|nr:MAG: hypothetical protein A2Y07_09685 [Planctomycetes bacterium GWF2_50_10]